MQPHGDVLDALCDPGQCFDGVEALVTAVIVVDQDITDRLNRAGDVPDVHRQVESRCVDVDIGHPPGGQQDDVVPALSSSPDST